MPYKTGKLKGELTTPEIRKLIRAHNVLVSIKIPKGAKREDIMALVKKNGYEVNHEKQALVPKVQMQRKKTIGLKKAQEITKPKPLTEEQKKKKQQAKQKKAGEKAFLKKAIPAPPKPSKPSKGIKVGKPPPKSKKEDEVRPARIGAPPIPKAKEFVKIGGRPSGKKVDTNTPKNVGIVDTTKPKKPKKTKEEKLANRKKFADIKTREENLKRVKKLGILVDAINQFNQMEVGKSLKKPLRTANEDKSKLIEKIVAYDIDKVIDIDIPDKVERKKMTDEEKQQKKKQKQEEAKIGREKEKPFKGLRQFIGKLYAKYNKLLRDNQYKDVKSLLKKMQNEFDEAFKELEEQAEEKDIELDDGVYEELEEVLEQNKNQLKDIAERGLKGEFTAEFKKVQKEKARKERDSR